MTTDKTELASLTKTVINAVEVLVRDHAEAKAETELAKLREVLRYLTRAVALARGYVKDGGDALTQAKASIADARSHLEAKG